MKIKQIEKEFDKILYPIIHSNTCPEKDKEYLKEAKSFYNKKILQIIDEMIGEEKDILEDKKLGRVRSDVIMSNQNIGYNLKRKELIQYKEKLIK